MKNMQTHSNPEAAQVWSVLVPHPLCYYDEYYDAHMVAWNGVVMTRSYALLLVTSKWMHMYPADSQKDAALQEFKKLVAAGVFTYEGRNLDTETHYDVITKLKYRLCREDHNWLNDMTTKYSAKEAFGWFMPAREHTVTRQDEAQF